MGIDEVFKVKQGSTLPAITKTDFVDDAGNLLSWASASEVTYRMRELSATVNEVLTGTAAFGATGALVFNQSAADVDTVTTYVGEWEVTYVGGLKRVLPTERDFFVQVIEDL